MLFRLPPGQTLICGLTSTRSIYRRRFQKIGDKSFTVGFMIYGDRLNPDDTVHYRYGASTYCAQVTLSHLLHLLAYKFIARDYLLVIDYNVLSR